MSSFVFLFIFFVVFLIIFSPTTMIAAFTGAPFLPTPKKVIKKALEVANLQPQENLYDLGSGNGRVLITGSKEFKANVFGFEYSVPLFCLSKINLALNGIRNSKIYRKSFLEADIKKADVVFAFLTPKAFGKLKNKLLEELRPGTRVVTYSSPLLFWEPEKIVSLPDSEFKIYFYVKK